MIYCKNLVNVTVYQYNDNNKKFFKRMGGLWFASLSCVQVGKENSEPVVVAKLD
jgi:hypothetical protein